MKRLDLTALNMGLLLGALAALGFWAALGSIDWQLVSIAAPLSLVVIGVLGLALSRQT
ncbi:MAG: hypothetical protein WAS07_07535 [Micropruina sp.]